jgi:uncharacterized membrane protein YqhA
MVSMFKILHYVIRVVACIIFAAGLVIVGLGIYDFVHAFSFFSLHVEEKSVVGLVGVGLLKAVDMFLLAIVLFVFALGLLILFTKIGEDEFPTQIPGWLRVKSFMELKIILWEAILTTLVVGYLARLAALTFEGRALTYASLVIPGAILLIALSVFFLKKSEH